VTATSLHGDYRVLVLAPFGKDAVLVREVLERSGIPVGVVGDVAAIARCVGGGAGAAVIAEESLSEEGIDLLGRSVSAQPAWSDFPIIVLTGGGALLHGIDARLSAETGMPIVSGIAPDTGVAAAVPWSAGADADTFAVEPGLRASALSNAAVNASITAVVDVEVVAGRSSAGPSSGARSASPARTARAMMRPSGESPPVAVACAGSRKTLRPSLPGAEASEAAFVAPVAGDAGAASAAFYAYVTPALGAHLPRILPHIRDGLIVCGIFGVVYFAAAMALGIPEARATMGRFLLRSRS